MSNYFDSLRSLPGPAPRPKSKASSSKDPISRKLPISHDRTSSTDIPAFSASPASPSRGEKSLSSVTSKLVLANRAKFVLVIRFFQGTDRSVIVGTGSKLPRATSARPLLPMYLKRPGQLVPPKPSALLTFRTTRTLRMLSRIESSAKRARSGSNYIRLRNMLSRHGRHTSSYVHRGICFPPPVRMVKMTKSTCVQETAQTIAAASGQERSQ